MTNDIFQLNDPEFEVPHGFFGRQGGVSEGIYSSLNCGLESDDDPEAVAKNRSLVTRALGVPNYKLVTLKQTHSARCMIVDSVEDTPHPDQEGDAIVTKKKGIVIAVTTADCVPVLFYGEDRQKNPVVGVAHSGWAGAFKGISESTIDMMCLMGASRGAIKASIGPCIGSESYEVDVEFRERFCASDVSNEVFFSKSPVPKKFLFDLPEYVEKRLKAAGLKHISRFCNEDTYKNDEHFFSYRRTVHNEEQDYGRQLSVIAL